MKILRYREISLFRPQRGSEPGFGSESLRPGDPGTSGDPLLFLHWHTERLVEPTTRQSLEDTLCGREVVNHGGIEL